jgi:hypothetical protein
MNKSEQETEFDQIQNGRQQKQTPVLNIRPEIFITLTLTDCLTCANSNESNFT